MPVIANFAGLAERIRLRKKAVTDDPALIEFLAQRLSLNIAAAYYDSGMRNVTGTLMNNLRYIGDPERSSNGWSIKIGKGFGTHRDSAPRGTIRAFLDWYRGQNSKPSNRMNSKGASRGASWAFAWWYLSVKEKAALLEERKAGRFGGETTYTVERSPYIWSQNEGNAKAGIQARGFISDGIARWRKNTDEYIQQYLELSQARS